MAFKRASLAKQTTQTTGTGTLTLIANTGSTRSIQDVLGTSGRGRFMLAGQGYFEHFRGTFTAPATVTRDETIKSSNADAPVNIPPGTTDVYLLDYAHFVPDRFSGAKTLKNEDASNSWIFTGSAAAALNFPAISTALPDFWGFVKNVGSAVLTLTGNGTDTFDESAATTVALSPGQSAYVFLDAVGAIWRIIRFQVRRPAFLAHLGVDQSITPATLTKVVFGVEDFDNNNNFASSRFTATVPGYYQFNAAIRPAGSISGAGVFFEFYKNGSPVIRPASTASSTIGGSAVLFLDVGDYVEVYGFVDGTGTTFSFGSASATCWFSGAMISEK